MKKILSTILATSLVASSFNIPPLTYQTSLAATKENNVEQNKSVTDLSKYETNQIIVVYKKDSNATEEKTLKIASLDATKEANAAVDELTDNSVVLSLESEETLEEAIEVFSNDSRVEYIQPNYIYHALDTNSSVSDSLNQNTDYAKQWALNNDGTQNYEDYDYETILSSGKNYGYSTSEYPTIQINAKEDVDIDLPEAWTALQDSSKATGTREAVVAFVDTGVMYDHTDLADAMWTNDAELNGQSGVDDDNNGYIDDVYGWNFYGSGSYSWFASSESAARPGFDYGDWFNSNSSSNGNNTYYNANSSIEDSHGTHGAGSVAAVNNSEGTVGIGANANVKIMSVKTLGGNDGTGTTESVVKGIQYAIDNGANIVNLSLGGEEDDETLRSVIKDNPNILFTIASGNGDSNYKGVDNDSTPTYPASYNYDNILCVANLQCDGNLHYSSNYGATTVHLAAPGANIYSTSTGDESSETSYNSWFSSSPAVSGYEYMTGTSMAAPIVAGVAAMLYSKYDNCTTQAVRKAILESVDTDSSKYSSLNGKVSSNGVLNAYRAVEYMEGNLDALTSYTPAPTTEVTVAPTATIKVTATPKATSTPRVTKSPEATTGAESSQAPIATNTPGNGNTTTPGDSTKSNTSDLSISYIGLSEKNLYIGKHYTIIAEATGGSGNYTYNFFVTRGDASLTQSGSKNIFYWTPTASGTYFIIVYVTDDAGHSFHATATASVKTLAVTIKPNKTLKKGATIKFTAKVNSGISPYKYTFTIFRNGKKLTSKTLKKQYITYKFKKTGTYKIKVTVKDSKGNSATKTITKKVK